MSVASPTAIARRRMLADKLQDAGVLRSPTWRAAVERVPRERFLLPGVFLKEDGRSRPVTPDTIAGGAEAWLDLAYEDETLVTQLNGSLTAADASGIVLGYSTSSSTMPSLVVRMLEDLEVADGHQVLEIGTGTGYSTALMCARLGEDNVTSVEVDRGVAARADAALEDCGYSTWTVTGDGLYGHPPRAPYDRVVATCAVRRIPYAWVRQTRPGGVILATVGSWYYGTGLAKLTVDDRGAAEGRFLPGDVSFMHARAHAVEPDFDSMDARTAYADSERVTRLDPHLLREWVPAFLTQVAAPGVRLAPDMSEGRPTILLHTDREAFAAVVRGPDGAHTVRQGGPVALWDLVEAAVTAWRSAGSPGIEAFGLRVTRSGQTVWLDTPSGRASWALA